MAISITIILVLIVFIVLGLNLNPVFGRKPAKEKTEAFMHSPNYRNGKFANQTATPNEITAAGLLTILRDSIKGNPKARPEADIPVQSISLPLKNSDSAEVTWFGHSAAMLQLDGKTLLLDPMFGMSASPFPVFGGKRYSERLPIDMEALPQIDAVFLSHDHYDHLDYKSIRRLKEKVGRFFVPLGVGSHLERWGVPPEKIEEHDWWDEFQWEGLKLAAAPARHMSGRSIRDQNATLWCSWVIEGGHAKIYFGGDSGYGPHFEEIGEKYGPFDLALLESGQYDSRWSTTHMMPEETVQAHMDVKGKVLLPIHWGAFTLAYHDWTEPIERLLRAAKDRSIHVATPRIGEPVLLGTVPYPSSAWWREA